MISSLLSVLVVGILISFPIFAMPPEHEILILEAEDPIGDQEYTFHPEHIYPNGDIIGARLILKKVLIERGEKTKNFGNEYIYIPEELTVHIDGTLNNEEVQLCIFIHLPPIHLEHIISRDSLILEKESGEEQIVLTTQSELSIFTGMEEFWDEEVLAFKASPDFNNCFFSQTRKIDQPLFNLQKNFLLIKEPPTGSLPPLLSIGVKYHT